MAVAMQQEEAEERETAPPRATGLAMVRPSCLVSPPGADRPQAVRSAFAPVLPRVAVLLPQGPRAQKQQAWS